MNRTPAKTKSLKQQLNRLVRSQKPRANRPKFRRRNLAIWAAFGTGITFGFSNIPLECSTVNLAFDYQPKTVEVDIQFRLTLEEIKYCEATQEKKNHVEERNIEE